MCGNMKFNSSADLYTYLIYHLLELTTKTGKVQGVVEPSRIIGTKVQTLLNIPYAEPPVGNLRFARPQPRKPWNSKLLINFSF